MVLSWILKLMNTLHLHSSCGLPCWGYWGSTVYVHSAWLQRHRLLDRHGLEPAFLQCGGVPHKLGHVWRRGVQLCAGLHWLRHVEQWCMGQRLHPLAVPSKLNRDRRDVHLFARLQWLGLVVKWCMVKRVRRYGKS